MSSNAPEQLQTSVVCHGVIPELDELEADTPWYALSRSRTFDAQVRCMHTAIEDGLGFLPASHLSGCHDGLQELRSRWSSQTSFLRSNKVTALLEISASWPRGQA